MGRLIDYIKAAIFEFATARKWENKIPVTSIKEDGNLLKGKTALIIGGSGGIGFAVAKKFADCGCNVILAGRNIEKLKSKSQLVNGNYVNIDIANIKDFDHEIGLASQIYGKIDILVCCQGIHTERPGFNFLTVTEEEYDSVMNVNLKGTYFLCQSMARYMIAEQIKGHILIISSERALEPSWSPYIISKRGLAGVVEGLAQVLTDRGIIVNAIGPGPTATTMVGPLIKGSIHTNDNPIGRYTLPEEIAEYAKMLVSDLGNTIVGQTIYMSGGSGIISKI